MEDTVLVTGATGFIAMHCVQQLLAQGWRVRGTLRSAERERSLRDHLTRAVDPGDRLELRVADLLADAGWDEAVAGCRFVLHVASPFPARIPDDEDELIVPAREGTLRVLRAAAAAGVERVVLTSSLAAVMYGHTDAKQRFDDDDWSVPERIPPYQKSKTLAERAAWDFLRVLSGDSRLELTTINPGIVLGPILGDDCRTSNELVRRFLSRDVPGCADIGMQVVDVRDVAAAHLLAMTTPAAASKRFCCSAGHLGMIEMGQILARHFGPRGYKVATRRIPSPLVRVFALFDKQARLIVGDLGRHHQVDTSRIQRVLGWRPMPLENCLIDTGESLIQRGLVKGP